MMVTLLDFVRNVICLDLVRGVDKNSLKIAALSLQAFMQKTGRDVTDQGIVIEDSINIVHLKSFSVNELERVPISTIVTVCSTCGSLSYFDLRERFIEEEVILTKHTRRIDEIEHLEDFEKHNSVCLNDRERH